MKRSFTNLVVSALAVTLAFSALYILSEKDQFSDVIYGSTYSLVVSPNSNLTIPLGRVSDRIEIDCLTVNLGSWSPYLSWDRSSSIRRPQYYSVVAGLLLSVAVNKSAFVLLEDYGGSDGNTTVDVKAFQSGDYHGSTLGETFQDEMMLNHMYQLKIGNYETSIKNQTGSTQFTIHRTNRSLEILVGALSSLATDTFSSPSHKYIITFTREPRLYLVTGLLVINASLIILYLRYGLQGRTLPGMDI